MNRWQQVACAVFVLWCGGELVAGVPASVRGPLFTAGAVASIGGALLAGVMYVTRGRRSVLHIGDRIEASRYERAALLAALLLIAGPLLYLLVGGWLWLVRDEDPVIVSILTVLALITVGLVWLRMVSGKLLWND